MLQIKSSVLVIIDVQGKLARIVHDSDSMIKQIQALIRGSRLLGIPIILTEQLPDKIGRTVPEVDALLESYDPPSKETFSCCRDSGIMHAQERTGRKQILVAGIEGHVCVYQTVCDLLESGYEVYLIADAISSRSAENRRIALERMRDEGAKLSCVEMVLFELQGVARGSQFKELIKIIK